MFATIIRSFLRPTRPDEDDHSSLHVEADVDRKRDQERWERERERGERERRRASRLRVQPPGASSTVGLHPNTAPGASSGSMIELAPRLSTLAHGSVTGSTEPAQSVSELGAPVLDRTAVVFPAHGGLVSHPPPQSFPIPHLPIQHFSPNIGPPASTPQPKSARLATTATLGPVDGHGHHGGQFNDDSAAESPEPTVLHGSRVDQTGAVPLVPPQPSQSPVISELDYRPMNISAGLEPGFTDSAKNAYQLNLAADAVSAIDLRPPIPSAQLYTKSRVSNKVYEDNNTPPAGPSSSVAGVVGTGSGIPEGTVASEAPKKRSHRKKSEGKSKSRSSDKENEQNLDKGKGKLDDLQPTSTKDKDRDRRREEKEPDTRTKEERERDRRERKERKERRREKREKREAEKEAEKREAERLAIEKRELEKREVERREAERREVERREAERREAERRASQKREAEKREAEKREADRREAEKREAQKKSQLKGKDAVRLGVPPIKTVASSSKTKKDAAAEEKGILRPFGAAGSILGIKSGDGISRITEQKKPMDNLLKIPSRSKHSDGRQPSQTSAGSQHHSHSHSHQSIAPDSSVGPSEHKKVTVRTPQEEAERQQRKAERAKARALKAAMKDGSSPTGSGTPANVSTAPPQEIKVEGDKSKSSSRKSKSSRGEDGKRRHKRDETEEERSERRARRRARQLAESLKLETANDPPIIPTAATEKILSSTHLPYIPPPTITPLSPSGRLFQPPSPIPELPELGDTQIPSTLSALNKEPKPYTESQIPPRPRTPPPAAYFSSTNLTNHMGPMIAQPEPIHYQEDKIAVAQELNLESSSSRRKTNHTRISTASEQAPEVVPIATLNSPKPVETKEERRQRRAAAKTAAAPPPYPSSSAAPSASAPPRAETSSASHHEHHEHHEKPKRSAEESAARRARRDARKAEKVAAANAALKGEELLQSKTHSSSHTQPGPAVSSSKTRLDSGSSKGPSPVKPGSRIGIHHDPKNEPGYGHYGYGINTAGGPSTGVGNPAPPPTTSGHRHRNTRKSVVIDEGARDEGPGYHRDGKEKERERERERIRKEKEKEAKAAAAAAAAASGKRFGRFSLKRSFSRLFTG